MEEKKEKRINPFTLQEEFTGKLFSNKFILIGLLTILASGAILYFSGQLAPNSEADHKLKIQSEREDSLKNIMK